MVASLLNTFAMPSLMTGEADSLNSDFERLIFVKMIPEEQRLLLIRELVVGLDHQ